MRWEAICTSCAIAVGTRLCIFWTSRMDGQVVPDFAGDHEAHAQMPDGSWLRIRIEAATATSAVLIVPDGARYQITPRRTDELPSRVDTGRLTGADWIVRSAITPIEPPLIREIRRR